MSTQFEIVTSTTPADTAALAEYLINRYLDRTNFGAARDLQKFAINVGLGNGFLYDVLKTFSIQTAYDTVSISAVLTSFKAWVPAAQQSDVNAIITAIQTAQATHQAANPTLYVGVTPFDVWAKNAAPSLDAALQTAIGAATVAGSTVSLIAGAYITPYNDGQQVAQTVDFIEGI